jgi:hypothetical protein
MTGFVSIAGGATAGRTGGAGGGVCCLRMADRTSPGREMCERSIFVLISSGAGRAGRALEAACASPAEPRRRARTFSASWSSRELEWVFFSVTPTSWSTSRIALLLTSSSRARSLIRILLIRPFAPHYDPLSLHVNLTAAISISAGSPANIYPWPSEGGVSPGGCPDSDCPDSPAGSASTADSAPDGAASAAVSSAAAGAASCISVSCANSP